MSSPFTLVLITATSNSSLNAERALSFSIFYGSEHCGPEWFDDNEYKLPRVEREIIYNEKSLKKFVADSFIIIKDIVPDYLSSISMNIIVHNLLNFGYHVDNNVEKDFSIVFSIDYIRVAIHNSKTKGTIISWFDHNQESPIIYDTLFQDYQIWAKKYFYYDFFSL